MNSRHVAVVAVWVVACAAGHAQSAATEGGDALPASFGAVEEAVGRIRASYDEIRLRFTEKERQLRQAISAQEAAEAQARLAEARAKEVEADRDMLRERNRRIEGDLSHAQETIAGLLRTVTNLEEQVAGAQREARKAAQDRDALRADAEKARERMLAAERERDRAREALYGLEARLKEIITGAVAPSEPTVAKPEPPRPEPPRPEPVATQRPEPPKPAPEPETARPPSVADSPALQLAPKPAPEPPAAMVAPPPTGTTVVPASSKAPPIPEPILSNAPPTGLIAAADPLTQGHRPAPDAVRPAPSATDRILADASAAFDAGDWAKARAAYREVLSADAANPVAAVGLTEVLMQIGETREARERAQALLAADPASARRLFLAGRAAARDGRTDEALDLLTRAMQAAPENADVKRELAAVLFDQQKHREAADMFVAVTKIDSHDGESWFNACASLLMLDPMPRKQALEYYEKALRLGEPRDERIEKRLGSPAIPPDISPVR